MSFTRQTVLPTRPATPPLAADSHFGTASPTKTPTLPLTAVAGTVNSSLTSFPAALYATQHVLPSPHGTRITAHGTRPDGPHTNRRNSIPFMRLQPKRCTPQGLGYPPSIDSGASSRATSRHPYSRLARHSSLATRHFYPIHTPPLSSLPRAQRRASLSCTFLHFFALRKNLSPVFSSNSTLFAQNTRGGVSPQLPQPIVTLCECGSPAPAFPSALSANLSPTHASSIASSLAPLFATPYPPPTVHTSTRAPSARITEHGSRNTLKFSDWMNQQ